MEHRPNISVLRPKIYEQIDPEFRQDMMPGLFGKYLQYGRDPDKVNLGHGYPDMDVPQFLKDSLVEVMSKTINHQYSRPAGPLGLAEELSKVYSPRLLRHVDPVTEIIVSNGATELYSSLINLMTKSGDEIIYFEPCYAFFIPLMYTKGRKGVPISVINGDGLALNREKFEAAFSPRTKIIAINSPHNPTGKVFTKEEVEYMCEFLRTKYPDVLVISDDVYCDFPFGSHVHTQIAAQPGMWNRTITLFSLGKVFGTTGWRLGVGIGPQPIVEALATYQTLQVYCGNTPISMAAERALRIARTQPYKGEETYFIWLRKTFESKAEKIFTIFQNSGLDLVTLRCEGGYFLTAKIEKAILKIPVRYFYNDYETNTSRTQRLTKFEEWRNLVDPDFSPDYAYCNYLAIEKKIVCWPISAFYDTAFKKPKEKKQVNMIRMAICRSEESIVRLAEALKAH